MSKKLNIKIGEKIGDLEVIELVGSIKGRTHVKVRNTRNGLEKIILASRFRLGQSKVFSPQDFKGRIATNRITVKEGDTNGNLEIVKFLGSVNGKGMVIVKNTVNGLQKQILTTQFLSGKYKLLTTEEMSDVRRRNNQANKVYTWKDFYEQCKIFQFEPLNCPPISQEKISDTYKKIWDIKCFCGRTFRPLIANILKKNTKSCGCIRSWAQIEINSFITSLGFETLYDQDIIAPLQIDIFIPSQSIAIEYNGLHWHGEKNLKEYAKTQLIEKQKKCQEKGFRLIVIFEDEWLTKQDQVKEYLKAVLGVKSLVVGARKCEIVKYGAKDLCKSWHLQGIANGLEYSLLYKNEIVAGAIFAKPNASRANFQANTYELARFCVKPDISVPGALSRLIGEFKLDNPGCNKLISYSDNRWSEGGLYRALGFTKETGGTPSYWYFKDRDQFKRYHRYTFRKRVLIKKYDADASLTEWEIASANGWDRIWDLGASRWVKDV